MNTIIVIIYVNSNTSNAQWGQYPYENRGRNAFSTSPKSAIVKCVLKKLKQKKTISNIHKDFFYKNVLGKSVWFGFMAYQPL